MEYTGFSEHELKRIIEILEEHHVPFEVSANEAGIETANAVIASPFYHSGRRGAQVDNSFYSISFDRNGLKNLSQAEIQELKKLRIFPEEMAEPEAEVAPVAESPRKRNIVFTGNSPVTAVVIILALLCLAWGFFNFQ